MSASPRRSRIKQAWRWQLSPSTAMSSFTLPSYTRMCPCRIVSLRLVKMVKSRSGVSNADATILLHFLVEMQHEVLAILAEAHDYDSYLEKLELARGVFANYEGRLANGEVDIRELVVSKRITKEPRGYQKTGVTAIAAQRLFGSGVKLRPGQNIEYVTTNSEARCADNTWRGRTFPAYLLAYFFLPTSLSIN